jgi:hypothetical protein
VVAEIIDLPPPDPDAPGPFRYPKFVTTSIVLGFFDP